MFLAQLIDKDMESAKINWKKSFLTIIVLIWCLPVLWVFVCAFKQHLFGGIPTSLTTDWTIANFLQLGQFGIGIAFVNSFGVALLSSLIGTVTGLLLSLGLICRPKPLLTPLLIILSGRTVPPVLFLLPQYLLARRLGINESRLTLSLVHSFGSLSIAIILLSPFILQLHTQFSDQARLDESSDRIYFSRIIIPQLYAPLAFSVAVSMLLSWTDYLFASIFTVGVDTRTLPVLIGNFITSYGTSWGPMYASLSLSFFITLILTVMALIAGSVWLRKKEHM